MAKPPDDGAAAREVTALRDLMVDRQLRCRGIRDVRVLEAMRRVPREQFVPERLRELAHEDGPLPIGCGQTISQPFTVAFMCQALRLEGKEKVLEIGTGSGYGAAVLSRLAEVVYTIERVPSLGAEARSRLKRLGYGNVHVRVGDGTLGLAEAAPFDGMVVTAACDALPETYVEQLAEEGRLVIPLGPPEGQKLYCLTRRHGGLEIEELGAFAFVPLIGAYGYPELDARKEWR